MILRTVLAVALAAACTLPALAGGWSTVGRYVHPTGRCGLAREVLASWYEDGAKRERRLREVEAEHVDPQVGGAAYGVVAHPLEQMRSMKRGGLGRWG